MCIASAHILVSIPNQDLDVDCEWWWYFLCSTSWGDKWVFVYNTCRYFCKCNLLIQNLTVYIWISWRVLLETGTAYTSLPPGFILCSSRVHPVFTFLVFCVVVFAFFVILCLTNVASFLGLSTLDFSFRFL